MELLPDTRGHFNLGTAVANVIYAPMSRSWCWWAYASVNPPDIKEIKDVVAVHAALTSYGYKAELENLDGFRPGIDFIGVRIPKELEETILLNHDARGLRG